MLTHFGIMFADHDEFFVLFLVALILFQLLLFFAFLVATDTIIIADLVLFKFGYLLDIELIDCLGQVMEQSDHLD